MATQTSMAGTPWPSFGPRPWHAHYETGVPATLSYPEVPLHRFLADAAAHHPERRALVFFAAGRDAGSLTYRRLDAEASRFAAALARLGVQKGHRVALLMPNMPQMVIAYYGALRAGAVVVPTNPLYSEKELEFQLNDSGATVAVVMSRLYGLVAKVRGRTPLEHVVVANIKDYFSPLLRVLFTLTKEKKEGHRVELGPDGRTHHWPHLLASAPATAPRVDVRPDDLALLQYTGGTTGTAKGAMLTHRNLVANVVQTRSWITTHGERGYDVVLGVLPFFHIYGMTTVMNLSVLGAGTMVVLPRFEVKDVLLAIQRHRPNVFPGVPTMYMAINNFPGVDRYDLRSISACISGAAPLPGEVQTRFEALTGARLVEGYGLTEASPVTHANPLLGKRKVGSIGVPFPDTDARILDMETGTRELPIGEVGELAVCGPQVMQGYWRQDAETAHVLRDGWLLTGDIARQDEEGFFYIVDRKKDVIISGGMNVYPRDVEEPLYAHPKVKEAVAVGVPDERWGEAVKVFIVLREGQQATAEEIIEYCHGQMARYKVPKYVEFRSELPKTMVGKFLRRVLQEEERKKREGMSGA